MRSITSRMVAALLVVLLITACGSRDEPTVEPTSPPDPTATLSAPTAEPTATQTTDGAGESQREVSPLGQPVSPLDAPEDDAGSIDAPEPSAGLATVVGSLNAFSLEQPIRGTAFYLGPAQGDDEDLAPGLYGASSDEGNVNAQTDTEGRFVLTDVPPGRYILAVWAPYDWPILTEDDGSPRFIEVEPDQILDLGDIVMPWP